MELGPNQKRWVAALRSGEYRQGRYSLYDSEKKAYCCLGVAVSLFHEESISGMTLENYPEVTEQLSLGNDSGTPESGLCLESLVAMNDEGSSFSQIADTLEKHAVYYFKESR